MIYIIDNGLDYSDHVEYFVEVPDEHAQAFEAALAALQPEFVIEAKARVKDIEWLVGGPMSEADFFCDYTVTLEAWAKCDPQYRRFLIEEWNKDSTKRWIEYIKEIESL